MSFDENPYAPPKADPVEDARYLDYYGVEAWRDGNLLVIRKGSELGDHCLKCNAPAEGYRFSRLLSWHRPAWFLLILVSWLLYLLVYFLVRWQARVTVGLCPLHRARRTRAIALGWLASLLGIGLIVAGAGLLEDRQGGSAYGGFAILAGALLILLGLIGGMMGAQVLVPRRINEHYVWLSKVSPEYMAKLPDWNR